MIDAVLRKGLPLEAVQGNALRPLASAPDRALALAIVAEVLRRLPDLDALIDSATPRPLPDDSKARTVLRIALAQALRLGTPPACGDRHRAAAGGRRPRGGWSTGCSGR
jgi:16S rRNA (cytosine967-C5)-methyltransferase